MMWLSKFVLGSIILVSSVSMPTFLYSMEGEGKQHAKNAEGFGKTQRIQKQEKNNVISIVDLSTQRQFQSIHHHSHNGFLQSGNCGAMVLISVLMGAIVVHNVDDHIVQFFLSYF